MGTKEKNVDNYTTREFCKTYPLNESAIINKSRRGQYDTTSGIVFCNSNAGGLNN